MNRARPSANIAGSSRLTSSAATVQIVSSAPNSCRIRTSPESKLAEKRTPMIGAPAATKAARAGAQISIEYRKPWGTVPPTALSASARASRLMSAIRDIPSAKAVPATR